MGDNAVLNNAKYAANTDEWYTPYEIISEELVHYESKFRGKVVLCNCDDPLRSNFAYYFMRQFNKLGLKALICTSYEDSKLGLINGNSPIEALLGVDDKTPAQSGAGKVLRISSMPGDAGKEAEDEAIVSVLHEPGAMKSMSGNGDFRSPECIKYLKECDICCTNPPFSLFADLFSLIMKHGKQFLLIGNQNALTYKDIFPKIMENKAWVGYRFGDMAFRVPSDTEPRNTRYWVDDTGCKWRSLGNAMWLTNLDIPKRRKELSLTRCFDPEQYPRYDTFDAIDVSRVVDIPFDYDGIMGVPITFLKYYNDTQFEIVGEANHGSDNEFDLFRPTVNGKQLFKRILIRRKQPDEHSELPRQEAKIDARIQRISRR